MTKLSPPSRQTLEARRVLSSLPRKTFTGEQAAQQVKLHLAEAKRHFLQNGQANEAS
ncbi:MAG: hypothetical protein ACKVY0_28120 [Prosthecobacter sp.]|uniref:hypothetical protein n=1 Tax=Prosthecobacter sp. TaxID=1965333 RepID=UPI0038FD8FAD